MTGESQGQWPASPQGQVEQTRRWARGSTLHLPPTSSASRGFVTLSVAVFPLPPFVTLSLKEAITE